MINQSKFGEKTGWSRKAINKRNSLFFVLKWSHNVHDSIEKDPDMISTCATFWTIKIKHYIKIYLIFNNGTCCL